MNPKAFNGPVVMPSLAEGGFNPTSHCLDDRGWPRNAEAITAANSTEQKDLYEISLAAPGLRKEDSRIEVGEGRFITQPQKEEEKEHKDNRFTRQGHPYTSFAGSFTMPNDSKREAIAARYANGVLNRKLPRKGEAQRALPSKTIAVK